MLKYIHGDFYVGSSPLWYYKQWESTDCTITGDVDQLLHCSWSLESAILGGQSTRNYLWYFTSRTGLYFDTWSCGSPCYGLCPRFTHKIMRWCTLVKLDKNLHFLYKVPHIATLKLQNAKLTTTSSNLSTYTFQYIPATHTHYILSLVYIII